MSATAALCKYAKEAFRWQSGRQGSGYDKMLLLTAPWPLPFDSYLIRYPEGSSIQPHRDPVQDGRHYRLNIILKSPKSGGEFVCASPIYSSAHIKLFRPDIYTVSRKCKEAAAMSYPLGGWWARVRPNPSIERTVSGMLRMPPTAAHVER